MIVTGSGRFRVPHLKRLQWMIKSGGKRLSESEKLPPCDGDWVSLFRANTSPLSKEINSRSVPMVISRISDHVILYCNPRFAKLLKTPISQLLGYPLQTFHHHPTDLKILLAMLERRGCVKSLEVPLIRSDHTVFWVAMSSQSFILQEEKVILSVYSDINKHKESDESLRRQALTFEHIYDGIVITDVSGHIIDWNPGATRIFGYKKEEVIGKTLEDLEGLQDLDILFPEIKKSLREEGRWVGEISFIRQDGSRGVCETSIMFVYDQKGVVMAIMGIHHDITQRKQAEFVEKQLLASIHVRARQQAAVAYLGQEALEGIDLSLLFNQAVGLVAQTLNVDFCSLLELLPGNYALFMRAGVGWQKGLVGNATVTSTPRSQAGYTLQVRQPVIVEDLRLETRFSGSPLLHNHRVVSGVTVIIPALRGIPEIDYREEKETNNYSGSVWGVLGGHTKELRHFNQDDVHFLEAIANVLATAIERTFSEERLRLMERAIQSSSNGVVITDATLSDNPIIYVNPSFERMTGYKRQDVVGKNCRFLQRNARNQESLDSLREAISEGKECTVILKNFRRDGSLFWNELSIAPVYNSRRHLTHFVGIQTDITERKTNEEESLQTSQALATFSANLKQLHRIATYNHKNIDELFSDYLLAGCEIFGMEIGVILEITDEVYIIRGIKSDLKDLKKGSRLNPDETICRLVVAEKKTVYLNNIGQIEELKNSISYQKYQVESCLGTPIFVNDKMYGILSFLSGQVRPRDFATHEYEIIELMTQSIGRFIAAHETELERKKAEIALKESEERYRRLVEMSPEGIAIYCQGNIVYINAAGAKLLGGNFPTDIINKSLFIFIHPDYLDSVQLRIKKVIEHQQEMTLMEHKLVRLDGEILEVEMAGIPAVYEGKMALQIIIRDITERKRAQEQLLHDAFYDPLTGLPNRALFMDRLGQAVRRSMENLGYVFAVLFLDLDRFKVVNDSLGHLVGDKLLIEFAQRLQNLCTSSSDTVSRLGGDEFTILLEDVPKTEDVLDLANKIHKDLKESFTLDGHDVFTTVSIGIVFSQQESGELTQDHGVMLHCPYTKSEEVLRDADIAMYRAKALGKARHEVFNIKMQDQTRYLLELETELRRAIKQNCSHPLTSPILDPSENLDTENFIRLNSPTPLLSLSASNGLIIENKLKILEAEKSKFLLYYQPIISLQDGKIKGFESLIRWQHPTRGLVSPAHFIPVAEETGLIIPLGIWVLREACYQLQTWQKLFNPSQNQPSKLSSDQFPSCSLDENDYDYPLSMSVNLSGKQLIHPNLIEKIDEILDETGCNPRCLKLEITESVIMENVTLATTILAQLKQRKIRLSIDDFGTGYSSLSYLHRFPLDTLKIDRSFVNRLGKEGGESGAQPLQIVRAIITLAHNLGLDVVAEGIETSEQLQVLESLGCELGQGFLFARPLESEVATDLIKKQIDELINYRQY